MKYLDLVIDLQGSH